jgi:hypothetical protein
MPATAPSPPPTATGIRGARRSGRDRAPAVESRDGRPVRVRLGGNWLPLERFQEAWVVEGRWWATEERRQYVRAEARGAVVELVRSGRGPWSVARVLD